MSHTIKKESYIYPIFIMGFLFFIFGFVSWVNSILIPYFRIGCELNHFQSYLVTFAFYIAYFIMSVPASFLLNKLGIKKGLATGLWTMALGALLFVPAAYTRTYGIFLAGLFILGTGLAILQTAANPYITNIGPIESAAKRISIMGLCNKFAGIISPLIFAALVLKASDNELFRQLNQNILVGEERTAVLDELIGRVMTPYAILALILFIFGLFIRYSSLPEMNLQKQEKEEIATSQKKDSIWDYPYPKIIYQTRALQICTVLGLLLSTGVVMLSKQVDFMGMQVDISICFLMLLGLPNALIYAGIWPLAIHGLGRHTNLGSSLFKS